MNKCLVYLLCLVFLSSCSWSKFNIFNEEDSKSDEIIEDFNFDDDIINKFKQKGAKNKEPVKKEKKVVTEKAKTKKKTEKKAPVKSKSKKKVSKKVVSKKKEAPKVVEKKKEPSEYPEDYPEKFKKYDLTSKELWKKIKPFMPVGETMVMEMTYLGVVVAKVALSILPDKTIGERSAYHLYAQLKSAPFYKYIYSLDDTIESFIDKKRFLPIKYSLIQRESKQSIDDIQLFDHESKMTYFRMKKIKKGKLSKKKKDTFIPKYFQDGLSAIYMLRSLPLKVGDVYKYPMVTRGKITIFKMTVAGIETLDTEIGERKAYKILASSRYSGDVVKKGNMVFWISADPQRLFLKLQAEIKIGSVKGSIVSVKN